MLPNYPGKAPKPFFGKAWHVLFPLVAVIICSASCKRTRVQYKNQDYSDEFKTIYHNVNTYYDRKKPELGVHYLDSAFSQIKDPMPNDRFRYYAFHFVYSKKVLHDPKIELLYADSMLNIALQSGVSEKSYVSNYAEASFAKGDAYFDAGKYAEAYQSFYQGYFIGKNYFDNSVLAEYTYRMGMVMFRQGHYDTAANYFKLSYRQSTAYHDDFRAFYQRQELLNDIGESYQQAMKADSAILYFNKTLAYINANNKRFEKRSNMLDAARAVTYGDMGLIYYSSKQYDKATDQFKKSIDINLRKFNDNANAELVEINLGRLYLESHQDNAFLGLMHNLKNQFDTVKNKPAETDWDKLMSNYYSQKNDFANAYLYFTKLCALKDSLARDDISIKETDVNQQQANYDKQAQIENLRDNNKLQLIYLYIIIVGLLLAVIIIFLIYRYWNRSKNDILIVSALNKQINHQKNELETTLDELNNSSQEKDRILRTVAHDLRNPIGGIVSLTNAMLDDDDVTEEQRSLLKLVSDTSNNSLELINEILEATNVSSTNASKEHVEINSLVNNSVEILSFKAAEKDQQIITELLDHPKNLFISQEKIWRVISNLISNAIKFSPNHANIRVKVANGNNEVKISVSDNGIGIPDEIKNEVFNIFTNAKRPGTAGEKSFGLGLSICQQIIENHNGKIWFESNVGAGTTFYVVLPAL
jgi:two-component system, OmpR family, sensor histidine kinase VicK